MLLAIVACGLAGMWLYRQFDEEVRAQIEAHLGRLYPHLTIRVRSAQWLSGEGLEIRGVSVFLPEASGPEAELLHVEELFVFCQADWRELLAGKLSVRQVVVRNPRLRVARLPDGSWSAARLLPLPTLGPGPPPGLIENGVIELVDTTKSPPSTLTLRDAHIEWAAANEPLVEMPNARWVRVQGELTGDHLRRLGVDAVLETTGQVWNLAGTAEGLDLSPELLYALPGNIAERLETYGTLRAQCQAQFRLSRNLRPAAAGDAVAVGSGFDFEVQGQLTRGRVDDPRLPYPLTELRGTFEGTPRGFAVRQVSARHGQASLQLDLERQGYDEHSPLKLHAEARRVVVDQRWFEALPKSAQAEWHKYLPSGEVDLILDLSYDGARWLPELTAHCHNVAFTYHKFPYRLERCRGTITVKDGQLSANLLAPGTSDEVRVVAELRPFDSPPTGVVEVRGQNVRIDEKLLVALPQGPRDVVRSLHPHGTFNLYLRLWRDASTEGVTASGWRKYVVLGLSRCSLQCDKFPYPLDDIRGTVELQDDVWTFRDDLIGSNDTGRISCQGHFIPTPTGQELFLRFIGVNVPLEEELRDALPVSARQMWLDMKPRGTVHLEVSVRYRTETKSQTVLVHAEPVGDTVSIEPAAFPYRLEKLRGALVFANGQVQLDRLQAVHGDTTVATRGHGQIRPGGGWELHLERLSIERLAVDRDLMTAVPQRLKQSLTALAPEGRVNLRGDLDLENTGQAGEPLRAAWRVRFDFHQNHLQCGVPLQHVNGWVALEGGFDGRQFQSRGEVQLDSVTVRDLQFTEVAGPLWLDDRQVLVGYWADRQSGASEPRRLVGKAYGGAVLVDGWALLEAPLRYAFQAEVIDAALERFAHEVLPGQQRIRGRVLATVDVRGQGTSIHGLSGRGAVALRDADIYELPVMVAMLKLLSVRTPDTTAFTESDIAFRIQGEHVYVDQIDFRGDAISLRGQGELDLHGAVRLAFYALVGRDDVRIPVLSELVGGASQLTMLIHVEGTMDQPTVRREALPAVNQALQQLQAGLQAPTAQPMAAPPSPAAPGGVPSGGAAMLPAAAPPPVQ